MGASRSCPVAVWGFSRSEGSPKGTFKLVVRGVALVKRLAKRRSSSAACHIVKNCGRCRPQVQKSLTDEVISVSLSLSLSLSLSVSRSRSYCVSICIYLYIYIYSCMHVQHSSFCMQMHTYNNYVMSCIGTSCHVL